MRFPLLGALALGASVAHAGISNGSFQLGSGTLADDWVLTGPNSLALTDADYIANAGAAGASPYGGRFLSFNAADGPIGNSASQTFATVAGQEYIVSYAHANYGVNLAQRLQVLVENLDEGDTLFSDVIVDFTGGTDLSAIWTEKSFRFLATGPTATLSFSDRGVHTASTDLLIDNVSVEAVPEPATLALLGAGLAAIARRRRA